MSDDFSGPRAIAGPDGDICDMYVFPSRKRPSRRRQCGRPVQDGPLQYRIGETLRFRVDDEAGGRLDGLRVYAGLRSDPFFIDLPVYLESVSSGRLAFTSPGHNSLQDCNVLSVVVEVDTRMLLQGERGPLFGIVGETLVGGKLPIRLERVGRPEVKNVILSPKGFDQSIAIWRSAICPPWRTPST